MPAARWVLHLRGCLTDPSFVQTFKKRCTVAPLACGSLTLLLVHLLSLGSPASASGSVAAEHTFTFLPSDVTIRETCTGAGYGDFVEVGYRGAEPDRDPRRLGHPSLPFFTRHFILPPETRVDELIVTVRSVEAYPGSYVPIPIQPDSGAFVPPDPGIYGSSDPYPEEPIRLTVDGYMCGYHLVTIQVWPVQFVGALERVLVVRDVEVEATSRPLTGEEAAGLFRRLRPDWEPFEHRAEVRWLRKHVLNPGGVEHFYRPEPPGGSGPAPLEVRVERPFGGFRPTEFPSLEGPPVEMVIITADQATDGTPLPGMSAAFQDWADWKIQKGVPTVVKTVAWIDSTYPGIDRPERMRAFVKDAAALWGTEHVCLGGDLNVVPSRILGPPGGFWANIYLRADPPADNYFAELDSDSCWNRDGDAFFAEEHDDVVLPMLIDVWLGRLPVRDSLEVAQLVAKLESYECRPGCERPSDASYYRDVLLAAGPTNGWCTDESNGIVVAEVIADSIETSALFDMDITRMYPDFPDSAFLCEPGGPEVRCFATMIDDVIGGTPDEFFTQDNFEAELDEGPAYVFHIEHSFRDFLGLMSDEALGTFSGCGACTTGAWKTLCKTALGNYLGPGWASQKLSKQIADNLTNGSDHRYFFLVTCGSFTGQYDLGCVGEHLLRNPNGGAIAYFARNASEHMYFGSPKRFFGNVFKDAILAAGPAAGLAVNSFGLASTKAGVHWRLLGDPEMPLWTAAPDSLRISQSPGSILHMGPQSITIEVKDDTTLDPVAGARVCIRDRDKAYAVAWTGLDGKAHFPAFPVLSADSISIVATTDNYRPCLKWLRFGSVSTPHCIVYDHHLRDDEAGGDGDDLLEAGETLDLRVVAKDIGTDQGSSAELVAVLWPTPPILFDFDIYGRYDARTIYIGAEGGHPPAVADTFRLPGTWHAIRPEGMPVPSGTNMSSLLVWRATDAKWHIRSLPGDDEEGESVPFEGRLVTAAGFDSVDCATCEAGDWIGFDAGNPDTLQFHFYPDDPKDEDELSFRAESSRWIEVLTESVELDGLASGDTASGVFQIHWDREIPDREEVVFTLAVHDTSEWWFSDFSEHVHAPDVVYTAQRSVREEVGGNPTHPWQLRIWPTVANVGSAPADQVGVRLVKTSGSAVVIADSVTWVNIGAQSYEESTGALRLLDTSSSAFDELIYTIEMTVHYPDTSTRTTVLENLDVVAPGAPTNVVADESGGAMNLRWTPSTDQSVVGYHVWTNVPGDTSRVTLVPLQGSTRHEVTGLPCLDSGHAYYEYRYAVTSVDASGNESDLDDAASSTCRVWLQELEHWPRRVGGGSDCCPKVYDLDGDGDLEIIAAGRGIHVWHHDGAEYIANLNDPDGLFYDPVGVSTAAHFVGALAVADIDGDGYVEIVGNMGPGGGLHVVRAKTDPDTVEFVWKNTSVVSSLSGPILENLNPAEDQDSLEVLLPADDDWVHVWTAGGRTFRNEGSSDGRFKRTPNNADWNHRSLSVADIHDSAGVEILQSLTDGHVVAYPTATYSTGTTCWIATKDGAGVFSTPVIGNLDGGAGLEIATTRKEPEGIWVLDAATGDSINWIGGASLRFAGSPHPPVSLAPLDENDGWDIVVGGGHCGAGFTDPARTLRVHTACQATSAVNAATGTDDLPLPGAMFACLDADGQAIVGDIDGDDDGILECLVPTQSGYLAGFEWDDTEDEMRAEAGWPQLFGEIPLPPVIANVDTSQYLEMVVQDRAGLVHLFQLPASDTAALPWPEYGHDPRNTFNAGTDRVLDRGTGDPAIGLRLPARAHLRVGPSPLREPVAWVTFGLEKVERVKLEVFDVQGRRIETLVDRRLDPGSYRIPWQRPAQSPEVASGIYFVRLTHGRRAEIRKVSIIR